MLPGRYLAGLGKVLVGWSYLEDNFDSLYRPRLVGHRVAAYAARAAVESWSCRTALGGLNPWRSISQVEL